MTDQRTTYLATIFYTDKDGGKHTIMGAIVAADYDDAMNGVLEAVAARPDCEVIVGGVIEPVDADTLAGLAATKSPHAPVLPENALVYRAPGTTVH